MRVFNLQYIHNYVIKMTAPRDPSTDDGSFGPIDSALHNPKKEPTSPRPGQHD